MSYPVAEPEVCPRRPDSLVTPKRSDPGHQHPSPFANLVILIKFLPATAWTALLKGHYFPSRGRPPGPGPNQPGGHEILKEAKRAKQSPRPCRRPRLVRSLVKGPGGRAAAALLQGQPEQQLAPRPRTGAAPVQASADPADRKPKPTVAAIISPATAAIEPLPTKTGGTATMLKFWNRKKNSTSPNLTANALQPATRAAKPKATATKPTAPPGGPGWAPAAAVVAAAANSAKQHQ